MTGDLATEQVHPEWAELDTLPTSELVALMQRADAEVPAAVERALPQIAALVDAVAKCLAGGGRLFYVGAGTSGRLGVLDASECPPTFDTPPEMVQGIIAGGQAALTRSIEGAEDNARSGAADLQAAGCCPGDIVIGIAASGRTPYVLGAVEKARMLGAVTGGVSCSAGAQLSAAVEYPVEVVVGAEVVAGSTRLRAGTATKLVLNMITTAAMVRLGYVYGNLMVNVQPTNGKLLDRARRIVAQATGLDAAGAETLLEQAGRSVRTAIVMQKKRISREQAEVLLRQARGRIREALASPKIELEKKELG